MVRPDARVQLEPHHPDSERRPRGAGRSKEARDPPGGEGDKGEVLRRLSVRVACACAARACVCVLFKTSEVFYVCDCFPFMLCGNISFSPLCKHLLTFLETSTASNVV